MYGAWCCLQISQGIGDMQMPQGVFFLSLLPGGDELFLRLSCVHTYVPDEAQFLLVHVFSLLSSVLLDVFSAMDNVMMSSDVPHMDYRLFFTW